MASNLFLQNTGLDNNNISDENYNLLKSSNKRPNFSTVDFSLTAEGGKNFFHYLSNYNLFKESDMLIIPPNHHYYYDENDLKNIRTLVILKKLNLIKERDTFLQTLYRMLPPNINFVGCFSDSETLNGNRFLSKLSNRLNNLLDSWTNHDVDKKYISQLLEKYGFKIIDMTEMNDLTYFYTQNTRHDIRIRA